MVRVDVAGEVDGWKGSQSGVRGCRVAADSLKASSFANGMLRVGCFGGSGREETFGGDGEVMYLRE